MSFDSDDQAVENPLNPLADKFILYIWPGEWGLPSLDPDCLTALCFLKYTHLQHEVVTVKNAWKLFKNEYPKLEYKNQFYVGLDEIIECIKKQKNIDQSLSDSSYADMFALLNLFKQKFIPAFNLLCWLDDDNTYTVIRRAYGNFVKFPLSMFKLKQMAVRAEDSITCHFRDEYLKLETIKQQVNFDAKECLNVLSSKLGENLFIFENRPCLLDAYLFGYLSVLSQAPFVNSPIKSHFTSCLNLEPLTKRIRRETCPSEKKENKAVEKSDKRISTLYSWFSISRLLSSKSRPVSPSKRQTKTETNTKTDFEAKEEWEKRKNQIMVIGLGITAMIAYAFAIGLIRIDVIKTDVEYIEKS